MSADDIYHSIGLDATSLEGKLRMRGFIVEAGGPKSSHPMEYTINRTHGLGCYLLLPFYVPVSVRTRSGVKDAEAGDMIIYDPSFPQWYRGRGAGLSDDWLHFDGSAVASALERLKLPLNETFFVRETRFVARLLDEIRQESAMKESNWQDMLELKVRELLLLVARQRDMDNSIHLTSSDRGRYASLRGVRMRIQKDFAKRWTLSQMATLAKLSPSRFSVLYRKFFRTSPIEDLIQIRLEYAKTLLLASNTSVKETAGQCGFFNTHYFSRLFSRRFGHPPRDFYQANIRKAKSVETDI